MTHPFLTTPLHAAPEVVSRVLPDGAVLVHLPTNRIFELNTTGSRIWELIGASLTPAQIADALVDEFAIDQETAAREIAALTGRLAAEGLVCA